MTRMEEVIVTRILAVGVFIHAVGYVLLEIHDLYMRGM